MEMSGQLYPRGRIPWYPTRYGGMVGPRTSLEAVSKSNNVNYKYVKVKCQGISLELRHKKQ